MTARASESSQIKPSWSATLKVYLEAPSLRMLALGFSAGLPLLLVLGTLAFRLREAGIDRSTIGFLSWIGLAYAVKWAWAPLVDRLPIPFLTPWLGLRRSWLVLAQIAIMAGLSGMAVNNPLVDLRPVVWCALAVAFGSATQDIALDAFRIESAGSERQAALAATYQTGYRLAMIWAGAGVLWIAARSEVVLPAGTAIYQNDAWQTAYLVMAASMLLGVITVLFSPEPAPRDAKADEELLGRIAGVMATQGLVFTWPLAATMVGIAGLLASMIMASAATVAWSTVIFFFLLTGIGCVGLDRSWGSRQDWHIGVPRQLTRIVAWLNMAAFLPFADFVRRHRRQAVLILALIAVYRISDVVMGIMANPFYVDMGYTKDEVAAVTKIYGVVMTLVGAFIGGALSMRLGVMRVLMLGAILSAASNLLFAWLGTRGHDVTALIGVISADNLSSGIASAAFIGYLSSLTNINYSATQYALFSSMMLLLPKWLAGFSGQYVDRFGYGHFFTATALLGVPVLLLVWLASRAKPG
jgi:PAT family beta-lactamase induction signal transducer AmpG